jgi:hypothetical protein
MDSAERKVTAFLQQVNTIHNRKVLTILHDFLFDLILALGGDAQATKRKSPSRAHKKNRHISTQP